MRGLLLGAALVVAGAAPLAAEVPDKAASAPAVITPADDLACAAWSAVVVGNLKDGEIKQGLSFSMVWFIGRWEAATGQKIEQGLTKDYIVKLTPELGRIGPGCADRMGDFGARMQGLGKSLQAAGGQ